MKIQFITADITLWRTKYTKGTDHGDWARYKIENMLSAKTAPSSSIISEAEEQQYKEAFIEADERELFKKIKIPQIVEAYYQVYHRLPENFPPVKEE